MSGALYPRAELEGLSTALLLASGADEGIARDVTWSVIETSLRGVDTHGLALLPKILARLEAGRTQLREPANLVDDDPELAVGVLDAKLTPGQHACLVAAREATARAQRYGIGMIAVRNSTHFGGAVPYLAKILEARQVGFCGSNSLRSMAAFGARWANLGNNPFGFAAPVEGGEDFLFDFSAAVMSYGRRNQYLARGEATPAGAFIKPEAKLEAGVCEVAANLEEIALPFGGHKGASMAVVVDVLSGLLASGSIGAETETLHDGSFHGPSQFVIAIEPKLFRALGFEKRLRAYIDAMHGSAASGDVRVPGEKGAKTRREREAAGIPVADALRDELRAWCEKTRVSTAWAR